jgi:DNA-binding MarR family transcriptional regulator
MKDTNTHLSTLKAMYCANLTRAELKVLLYLLEQYENDITDKAVVIASALIMDTTNLSRTLKSLKKKKVIAERKHTKFMYVQHYYRWGK